MKHKVHIHSHITHTSLIVEKNLHFSVTVEEENICNDYLILILYTIQL